jgi:pyruvate dehydrogenase E1 component alpha subunit
MYRQMQAIRLFEAQVNELYTRALMPGLAHLYIGEEAVAVGVCEALERTDYITSTHRGHGHLIAKGGKTDLMMAELFGRKTGYCHGKGGSMHIADTELGILGANGIVGGGIAIAGGAALSAQMRGTEQVVICFLGANAIVCGSAGIATGAAFSAKRLGTGQVSVCFFGEGALGQGVLYEVMNLAELFKLPVIYVCENNLYNEYTHYSETTAGDILSRATAFGLQAISVDGQNVRAVYDFAQMLVDRARRGAGPAFLLCNTYRYHGHHVGDINREYYRSRQEEQTWKTERDPIANFGKWLIDQKVADKAKLDAIAAELETDMRKAVEFAVAAPYPLPGEVTEDVYA